MPTLNMTGGDRSMQVIATPTGETVPSAAACTAIEAEARTSHTVEAHVDYAAKRVSVTQEIRLTNTSNADYPDIVVNLEPNRFADVVTMGTVTAQSADESNPISATAYELTGRRLLISLSSPLAPGCGLLLHLSYQLTLPPVGTGLNSLTGYFGYTVRQLNLGHWLATLAVRQGNEWLSHEASQIGEQIVVDTADWDVSLILDNAPSDLTIAAPGDLSRPDTNVWHYQLEDAREFTASMSDQFNVTLQDAADGVRVELYSFSDAVTRTESGEIDGAGHALLLAAEAVTQYSDLFGQYPLSRLIVVEGDFADGMEFSGMVFVSKDWFRGYTGDPASFLTIITIHEVSHQWWYVRVSNDQAMTPWLDEALATYSEYVFIEEHYPELRDWWWSFRVDSYVRSQADYINAPVDSSVYTFSSIRQYINAVYLRGARMLHALRADLGTDPFFEWLHAYAEAGRDRVVTPDVLWSLLTPEQLDATRATRETYLSDSNF
ncbi:MAG: M1 family metallopeptidase [Anaerolineae bacterium]